MECEAWSDSFAIEILERNMNLTFAQAYINVPLVHEQSWYDIATGNGRLHAYHLCLATVNQEFRYPAQLSNGSRLLVFKEPLPTWMKISFCLIGFGGSFYFSGLALGIMSIDITDLLLLIKAGTPIQKVSDV